MDEAERNQVVKRMIDAVLARVEQIKLVRRDRREPDWHLKERYSRFIANTIKDRLQKQYERLRFRMEMMFPGRMEAKADIDWLDLDSIFEDEAEANQLIALLIRLVKSGMDQAALETRLQMDYTLTNKEAVNWAVKYSYDLVRKVDKQSKEVIRSAVTEFIRNPDYSMMELFAALEPTFGEARAERIAITEVTRAYSQGQQMAAEAMREQFPGVRVVDRWYTNNDDLVCPVCGPLDGQEREHGELFYEPENEYQDGYPPRHPNCRCWISTSTRVE